jgi:Tat protein translocase TatB subunit
MFGLGGGELILVALLAIILIGPKDLPRVAQQLGKWTRQLKLALQEVKTTVEKEINPDNNSKSSH